MSVQVELAARGSKLQGALAEPAGSAKSGAVVVVQEWWGITEYIKGTCDRLAEAGLLAIAPDLYHGRLARDAGEAAALMGALDKQAAVAQIGETVAFAKAHARCSGKVAVLGFCMGGALAFASARHVDGIAAAVPFYGVPGLAMEEYGKIRVPILAHFAKRDDWAKASVAEDIQKAVRAGGGQMELHVYDAAHAFMRFTDSQVYDETSARLAWDRTIAFLRKHL
jgi:carboxymethylenebutenolidase